MSRSNVQLTIREGRLRYGAHNMTDKRLQASSRRTGLLQKSLESWALQSLSQNRYAFVKYEYRPEAISESPQGSDKT